MFLIETVFCILFGVNGVVSMPGAFLSNNVVTCLEQGQGNGVTGRKDEGKTFVNA